MMYWILFVMAAVVSIVIAVIVGGMVTPRRHTVARRIVVPVAPELVWTTIRDIAQYHEWRHELELAELVDPDQPQPRWRETRTNGSITFGIVEEHSPTRMVARMLDEDAAVRGEWRWDITTSEGHTALTITEDAEVANPLYRFFGTHISGYTAKIDGYLRHCATQLGVHHVQITDAPPL